MKNLHAFVQDYLHYTRSERNGLLFLFVLLLIVLFLPSISRPFRTIQPISSERFHQEAAQFYEQVKTATAKQKNRFMASTYPKRKRQRVQNLSKPAKRYSDRDSSDQSFEMVPFDPNSADEQTLLKMGLPKRVLQTLLNFRNKGGRFYEADDLIKIYGLREADYERLLPYVQIDRKTFARSKSKTYKEDGSNPWKSKKVPVTEVSINAATAEQWQALRGIGPAYSKRITKFRDALGGFVSIEQVADTYGLPDSTFQAILPYLKLTNSVRRLSINIASEKELKAHPYISWKQAKIIIKYRENHGPLPDFEAFKKLGVFSSEQLAKVEYYLDFSVKREEG